MMRLYEWIEFLQARKNEFTDEMEYIPSGNLLQFAIENCHRNSWLLPIKNGDFPYLCNSLPEGMGCEWMWNTYDVSSKKIR